MSFYPRSLLWALPACLFFTMTGCTASQTSSSPTAALQALCTGAVDSTSVKKAFDLVLDQTLEENERCIQMMQTYQEEIPYEKDGSLMAESQSQTSVISQWFKDRTLFQVLRNGTAAGNPPYFGLVRMNGKTTTQASFDVSAKNDVFAADVPGTLGYISVTENKALDGLKSEQIEYRLLGEELQPLTLLLGSEALIPPYQNPSLYSFSYTKAEDNGNDAFTITLKDPDTYDKKALEVDASRPDALKNSGIQDVQVHTDTLTWTVYLDEQGAITSFMTSKAMTMEGKDQSVTVHSSRQGQLNGIASNQSIGYLEDVFNQLDGGSLRRGQTFQLQLSIADPSALEALEQKN